MICFIDENDETYEISEGTKSLDLKSPIWVLMISGDDLNRYPSDAKQFLGEIDTADDGGPLYNIYGDWADQVLKKMGFESEQFREPSF